MRKNLFAVICAAVLLGLSVLTSPAANAADGPREKTSRAFDKFGGRFNAITYRLGKRHQAYLIKPQWCEDSSGFRTVVFVEGRFVRDGDGGYENWAFRGSFTRGAGGHEARVDFHVRTNAAAGIQCNL